MNSKEGMRAVWIGVAIGAGTSVVAEPIKAYFHTQSARAVARADHTEEVWHTWRERAAARERAYELVTRDERPRRRGQRKLRPYTLGMRPASQAGEAELFGMLDDIEDFSALIANARIDRRQLSVYLRGDIELWLPALKALRARSQPTFDARSNAQLEHAISTLEMLAAPSDGFTTWRALRVEEAGIWPIADGHFDVQASIFNPNVEDSPVPGICVVFANQAGLEVGHLLIWSARRVVPGLEAIPLLVTVPSSPDCVPVSVRLAAAPADLREIRGSHYPFSDAPSFAEA
jgi:hypothetical protein